MWLLMVTRRDGHTHPHEQPHAHLGACEPGGASVRGMDGGTGRGAGSAGLSGVGRAAVPTRGPPARPPLYPQSRPPIPRPVPRCIACVRHGAAVRARARVSSSRCGGDVGGGWGPGRGPPFPGLWEGGRAQKVRLRAGRGRGEVRWGLRADESVRGWGGLRSKGAGIARSRRWGGVGSKGGGGRALPGASGGKWGQGGAGGVGWVG